MSSAGPCCRGFHTKAILQTSTSSAKRLCQGSASRPSRVWRCQPGPFRGPGSGGCSVTEAARPREGLELLHGLKRRGESLRGGVVPLLGSLGAGSPGRINHAPLSERLCSVRLGKGTPALRDASQPGGLRAESQSILHSDLVSCCVASSLYLSLFVSQRENSGIAALTCFQGSCGWGKAHPALGQVKPLPRLLIAPVCQRKRGSL